MSRNLGRTSCKFCGDKLVPLEPPRAATLRDERGEGGDIPAVFPEYAHGRLIVARADCTRCGAKYLGWIDGTRLHGADYFRPRLDEQGKPDLVDASFRHAFNDEPAPEDYPEYDIVTMHYRRPWPRCDRCGAPMMQDGQTCAEEYTKGRSCSPTVDERCARHRAVALEVIGKLLEPLSSDEERGEMRRALLAVIEGAEP